MADPIIRTLRWIPLLSALSLAISAHAAVPGQVDFQGLLLDAGGQPVNGAVTLHFELFDALTGGSSLWSESHPDVSVVDGVYDVTLGSSVPLTPALLSTGDVFLEIEVDGETLAPRRQLLAVPYALRAEESDAVDGTAGGFLTQIVQHFNFDGGGPPNDDPAEGLTDVDGDGMANFIDPDNDGDGFSDIGEVAAGTDTNLVTPRITGLSPIARLSSQTGTVTVQGDFFDPGMTVAFGSETPTPTNVTQTSFDVTVGPQSNGLVDVSVTLPNGESASAQNAFLFRNLVVFTTFGGSGNLGGIAGADGICASEAISQGLPGTFLAWLADSTTSPAARFSMSTDGYTLASGGVVASSFADLTDGSILRALGTPADGNVWTGVDSDGTAIVGSSFCNDWTSDLSTDLGHIGSPTSTSPQWTNLGAAPCDALASLYCFEQAP